MCLDPSLAVTWGLASSIALKLHGMGLAAVLSYQDARHFLEALFTCVLYHEPLLIRVWCPSHEEDMSIISKCYFLYTDQVLYWNIVVSFLFFACACLSTHSSSASSSAFFFFSSRSLFFSNSFFNFLAELNTPFVPAPHDAQVGSFLYLFRAHGSQK